jgi:hypothetical protein
MNTSQISIVLFGHDARRLESRKWALHGMGYRVLTVMRLADLDSIPITPAIDLLVLCHTLSAKESAQAVAHASARWPAIKKLALICDPAKRPSRLLGQVRQTLDGPSRLLTTVSELVGYAGSSSYSHTY